MLFTSTTFLFLFVPLVIGIHCIILFVARSCDAGSLYVRIANTFLVMASLLFYAWGEPEYVVILIVSAAINYSLGYLLRFTLSNLLRLAVVTTAVVANLAILSYFKYMRFFADIIQMTGTQIPEGWSFIQNIALPLGISFYTFQGLSYVIDCYRKDVAIQTSLIDFLCYLTLFPQLVAGPIVRYSEVSGDIRDRRVNFPLFASGARRFIIGLAKKILLADTFARVADAAFTSSPQTLSAPEAWLALLCYSLQIYYDFSGYSDMAIGLGRMLGFHFPENFNYPYFSRSIQEFWRRWHMTLSRWLKDYLYIPLGGSRCASWRIYCNLLIVFALCGLWHGATFGFLAWGMYHGAFLILERVFPRLVPSLPRLIQHFYAFFVVMIGWILFRTEYISAAYAYCTALLGMTSPEYSNANVRLAMQGYFFPIALFAGLIFSTPVCPALTSAIKRRCKESGMAHSLLRLSYDVFLLFLFVFSCMAVSGTTYLSFIYFRF